MHRARELAIKATTSNSLFPLFIEMLNALNSSTNSNSIKVQLCAAYAYSPGQQSKMIARVPRRVVDVEEEDDFKWHSDAPQLDFPISIYSSPTNLSTCAGSTRRVLALETSTFAHLRPQPVDRTRSFFRKGEENLFSVSHEPCTHEIPLLCFV